MQLAQGGCSPKPLVPTQLQDPSVRTPAPQLHVARVHTCLRPCASPRVDLLRPSTSAAHAPPALCAQLQTCHQDKRHEPETPNGPRAGARRVSALHGTCHRPPTHPSHHSHHTTCIPAHISPRRAERSVGTLWAPRSLKPATETHPARRRAPVLANPRERRHERTRVAATTTALPARDPPHPGPGAFPQVGCRTAGRGQK